MTRSAAGDTGGGGSGSGTARWRVRRTSVVAVFAGRSWLRSALAFLLGALGIHLIASAAYVATVGRSHDVRRMDARWLAGPRPVQLMVAGDSHARFAVEAPVLGSAINVAVPGEHYGKTLYRLPWLLRQGSRRVRTVLLPFDAASFSSFKADAFEPEHVWGRYVDFLEVGRQRGAPLLYGGKWAKAKLAPYVGELATVMQLAIGTKHFRNTTDPTNNLGLPFFENGTLAAERHFAGADPFDDDMVWAFERIVEGCRRAGLRIVLVRFPVTRRYAAESRRLGADPADRDVLLQTLAAVEGLEHLDYEDLFFEQPGLFTDGDHLNGWGKRRFSLRLARDLARIGVLTDVPDPARFPDPGVP